MISLLGSPDASSTHPPPTPPPLPCTNQTRRVPHPVLIGHAASLTPLELHDAVLQAYAAPPSLNSARSYAAPPSLNSARSVVPFSRPHPPIPPALPHTATPRLHRASGNAPPRNVPRGRRTPPPPLPY